MKTSKNFFVFRISSLTPESLSMARLVEYLDELVVLFGSKDHVHFMKVARGSAAPAIFVDSHAEPKVHARLLAARAPDPPKELASTVFKLNKLLREDNAFGDLRAPGGAQILEFPGKKECLDDEVSVSELGSLEGQLVRLGGKDETAHATIEIESGYWENFSLTRLLARELAVFLYGDEIRVFGKGKWKRSVDGKWSLEGFIAERFERVQENDLAQTMVKLAEIQGNAWREIDNPLEELKLIRGAYE